MRSSSRTMATTTTTLARSAVEDTAAENAGAELEKFVDHVLEHTQARATALALVEGSRYHGGPFHCRRSRCGRSGPSCRQLREFRSARLDRRSSFCGGCSVCVPARAQQLARGVPCRSRWRSGSARSRASGQPVDSARGRASRRPAVRSGSDASRPGGTGRLLRGSQPCDRHGRRLFSRSRCGRSAAPRV